MDSVSTGHLIYLIVLGLAVAGWFFAQNRESLGKTTQQALIWGLIFIGVIGAVGVWQDIRDDVMPRQSVVGDGRIEVPLARDGHYYLTLNIEGDRSPSPSTPARAALSYPPKTPARSGSTRIHSTILVRP